MKTTQRIVFSVVTIYVVTMVCLLTFIAEGAGAATIHLTADPAGTQSTITATPFIPFTFYTVGEGFTPGTKIGRYEFSISLPEDVLSLGHILPAGAYNVGYGGDYRVTALLPLATDSEPVLLGTHIGMLTADVSDKLVTLGPASISSFGPAVYGYVESAAPQNSYPFVLASGLLINPENLTSPHAPEPATLGLLLVGGLTLLRRR